MGGPGVTPLWGLRGKSWAQAKFPLCQLCSGSDPLRWPLGRNAGQKGTWGVCESTGFLWGTPFWRGSHLALPSHFWEGSLDAAYSADRMALACGEWGSL